jgi:Kae1-associated kinase Bud32
MKLIAKGAEAEIYAQGAMIIKKRISKSYRIREIDSVLRRYRTRREAKVISKLAFIGVNAPALISADDESMEIRMQRINGKKARDILDRKNYAKVCFKIGEMTAKMHNEGIIHGDLTTSNIMIGKGGMHLIDFGLSFFSVKQEDKAVDIHLFRQALESKHNEFWEKGFKSFLLGYSKFSDDYQSIISRLEIVEKRGRNKTK